MKSFTHFVKFILFKNCDNIFWKPTSHGQVVCSSLRVPDLIGSTVNPFSLCGTPTCLRLQASSPLTYEEMRLVPSNVLNICEVHFLILLVLRSSKNFCTQKESKKLEKQFMAPNNNERFKCVTLWLSPWALETQNPTMYFMCCEMIENLRLSLQTFLCLFVKCLFFISSYLILLFRKLNSIMQVNVQHILSC